MEDTLFHDVMEGRDRGTREGRVTETLRRTLKKTKCWSLFSHRRRDALDGHSFIYFTFFVLYEVVVFDLVRPLLLTTTPPRGIHDELDHEAGQYTPSLLVMLIKRSQKEAPFLGFLCTSSLEREQRTARANPSQPTTPTSRKDPRILIACLTSGMTHAPTPSPAFADAGRPFVSLRQGCSRSEPPKPYLRAPPSFLSAQRLVLSCMRAHVVRPLGR